MFIDILGLSVALLFHVLRISFASHLHLIRHSFFPWLLLLLLLPPLLLLLLLGWGWVSGWRF